MGKALSGELSCPCDRSSLSFYFYLLREIRLDVSCDSSAQQRIHVKYQVLFSLKNNKKCSRLPPAAVMIDTLRVKSPFM